MKNQSGLIKVKLNQLNYLVKLCIYIKFEQSNFETGPFATEWFYQPNCPIVQVTSQIKLPLKMNSKSKADLT